MAARAETTPHGWTPAYRARCGDTAVVGPLDRHNDPRRVGRIIDDVVHRVWMRPSGAVNRPALAPGAARSLDGVPNCLEAEIPAADRRRPVTNDRHVLSRCLAKNRKTHEQRGGCVPSPLESKMRVM